MMLKPAAIKTATAALVMLTWGASAQAQVFTETFGTAAGRAANANVTGFSFASTGGVVDESYAVMRPQGIVAATGDAYWTDLASDHTGDTNGALMVLNAGAAANDLYRRDFNLEAGKSYRISAWRYVVNGSNGGGSADPLYWSLEMRNPTNNTALVSSGAIASSGRLSWAESAYEFTVPVDCVTVGNAIPSRLAITNRTATGGGNDFYVDDISVQETPTNGQALYCPTSRVTPAVTPTSVPVLDFAGLSLLSLLGAGAGALALRRRQRAK